jgi:hypothetical protein
MGAKHTESLLAIWEANDCNEWQPVVFDVVKELLEERGAPIPQQKPRLSPPTQKEVSLSAAHQLLRFLLIMVYLVGLQLVAYSVIRLSSQNYADALGKGLIGIVLIAGSLFSIKLHMSRTPCSSSRAQGLVSVVVLGCLPIGFFALWEYANQRIWENLLYISALVAIIAALLHMAKARLFSWLTFTVAPLAILCSLFVTEYEPLYGAGAYRLDSLRTPTFQPMHNDIAALVKSSDALSQLDSAGDTPEYFGDVESPKANIVIFGYDQKDNLVFNPFHIEGAVPESILAPSVSAVRHVVLLKYYVPRTYVYIRDAKQPISAQVLVYKWPEKVLVAKVKLDTGRNTGHNVFIVASSTARRLTAFLKAAGSR